MLPWPVPGVENNESEPTFVPMTSGIGYEMFGRACCLFRVPDADQQLTLVVMAFNHEKTDTIGRSVSKSDLLMVMRACDLVASFSEGSCESGPQSGRRLSGTKGTDMDEHGMRGTVMMGD